MLNRVAIKICGEEFILRTEDPPEYVQKIGAYVNELMRNVLKTSKVGLVKAAMLTAANIADEMFKTKEADEQLRNQIRGYLEESSRNRAEISDLKREILRLQKLQKKMEQDTGKEKPRTTRGRTTRARKEPETVQEPETVKETEAPDEPTGISSKTPRVTGLLSALEVEHTPAPFAALVPEQGTLSADESEGGSDEADSAAPAPSLASAFSALDEAEDGGDQ